MTSALYQSFALLLGAATLAGCHRQASPTQTATLLLSVSPQVATVLLDDQPVLARSTTAGPIRLRIVSGAHRLEVRALSHLTAYREVAVRPGEESVISVSLRRDPEAESEPASPPAAKQPFSPSARPLELPSRL